MQDFLAPAQLRIERDRRLVLDADIGLHEDHPGAARCGDFMEPADERGYGDERFAREQAAEVSVLGGVGAVGIRVAEGRAEHPDQRAQRRYVARAELAQDRRHAIRSAGVNFPA